MSKAPKSTSSIWIRNTEGNPSISATFAAVAFSVSTLAYVASIFEKIGSLNIRPFDSAACSAYLIPILSLYFGRRFTEAKMKPGSSDQEPKDKQ